MLVLVRTPTTPIDEPLEIEIDESTTASLVIAMVASITGQPPGRIDLLVPGSNEILSPDTVISSLDLGRIEAFQAVFSRNSDAYIDGFVNSSEQRRILEQIRRDRIEDNLRYAHEHAPESLLEYSLLFVDLKINNHDIRVIVDTGAQISLLPMSAVQQCDVHYLVDRRCQTTTVGIGVQRSIGRIHSLQLNIGGCVFTNPFVVVEGPLQTPLLGVDWLMKNRALIDLTSGTGYLVLQGGSVRVPFAADSSRTR
jgi:DNA damage-inducible protein 1